MEPPRNGRLTSRFPNRLPVVFERVLHRLGNLACGSEQTFDEALGILGIQPNAVMPLQGSLRRVPGVRDHERRHGLTRQGGGSFNRSLVVQAHPGDKPFGFRGSGGRFGHGGNVCRIVPHFKKLPDQCLLDGRNLLSTPLCRFSLTTSSRHRRTTHPPAPGQEEPARRQPPLRRRPRRRPG